jgi:hypothetical protein
MLQVYYIVDKDSDGVPDFSGTLLKSDTPNGVVVQGSDLLLSGFEDGKGMVWRLEDVHSYALRNQVRSHTYNCNGIHTIVDNES